MPASSASKDCLGAKGLSLPFRSLARLAQNEKLGCTGRKAGRRGGLGKRAAAMKKHRINAPRAADLQKNCLN
jgi:hypothetical protein